VINWNDLRYFLAIHRTGSLAGAAKLLKVDQTTVGRRLAALEDALDARLFDRTSDGLSLTAAGERALERASDLDERIGLLEGAVRGGDGRPEGTVRVATSENLAVPFFAERIMRVRKTYPGLNLELVTSSAFINLLRREADIAVRAAPRVLPDQQNLIVRKVAEIGLALYASRAYLDSHPPVVVADGLAGHDIVLLDGDLAETVAGRWIAEAGKAARPVLRVNSFLNAASAAAVGGALALVPCFATALWPSLVRATADNALTNELWILVVPDLLKTARVRAVYDHIVWALEVERDLLMGRVEP
jgi:DNA-binding transcriptional LysR family regulator